MALSSPELNFDPLAAYKKDSNSKAYQEGWERIFGKHNDEELCQKSEDQQN